MQSLEDIPEFFADVWGITDDAAKVFLSLIIMLAVVLPIILLDREGKRILVVVVLGVMTLAFLVGIEWLPFWMLIVVIMMIAFVWALLGSEAVTGSG